MPETARSRPSAALVADMRAGDGEPAEDDHPWAAARRRGEGRQHGSFWSRKGGGDAARRGIGGG
jgi:hypothetical protein